MKKTMMERLKTAIRRPPVITVLRLEGVISSQSAPLRGSVINLHLLEDALERAFRPKRLVAVALQINSPGGSPVQSAMICRRIRALAEERNVPVFAFAEDVAASGGYMLALAADEIHADTSSLVGSIGVITATFGFAGLMEKLGIERRLYTEGDRKSLLDPFSPEREEDVARLRAIQKALHEQFKTLVKERRGERLPTRRYRSVFNGDVFTATKALDHGLIDGIGDLRSVLRERFGKEVDFRPVGQRRGWLQRRFGLQAGGCEGHWTEKMLCAAENRSLWARFGL